MMTIFGISKLVYTQMYPYTQQYMDRVDAALVQYSGDVVKPLTGFTWILCKLLLHNTLFACSWPLLGYLAHLATQKEDIPSPSPQKEVVPTKKGKKNKKNKNKK